VQVEDQISSDGLPAPLLADLRRLRADDQTIAAITNEFITADANAVARVSTNPLAVPALIQSLLTTANALG
jgi:hypothetical protein